MKTDYRMYYKKPFKVLTYEEVLKQIKYQKINRMAEELIEYKSLDSKVMTDSVQHRQEFVDSFRSSRENSLQPQQRRTMQL